MGFEMDKGGFEYFFRRTEYGVGLSKVLISVVIVEDEELKLKSESSKRYQSRSLHIET